MKIEKDKELGKCKNCGEMVYRADFISFEDDYPYEIEGYYFHERCIMEYAKRNWSINAL